jgi:hypothetical protein
MILAEMGAESPDAGRVPGLMGELVEAEGILAPQFCSIEEYLGRRDARLLQLAPRG